MFNSLELTKQLIACKSVSPEDAGCQEIISNYIAPLGFKSQNMPFVDVKNLWAFHKETTNQNAPMLVFAGHTDVVPAGDIDSWDTDPFEPVIKDGILYGRGACDMKGGLAAMICAACEFVQENPNYVGNIGFLITSDEEAAADHGTKKVIKALVEDDIKIDAVVIGEPSSTNKLGDIIRNGRRGSITFTVDIIGIQGHVAYPHLADNPIHKTGDLLNALSQHIWDEGNKDFPPSSLQIVEINSGGEATNIVPATAKVVFNIRFSTEHTENSIAQEVKKIISSLGLTACTKVTHSLSGVPFITDRNNKIVQSALQAIKQEAGLVSEPSTGGGTSDGRFIAPLGIDVIELGVINATAHKVNESVRCADLELLQQVYKNILQRYFNI